MTEKRWTLEESENQDTIFDNEGPDDYYHLGNDTRDVKAICDRLNEYDTQIKELQQENQQFKKTLRIIADAESARKSDSVKEILRDTLFGLDSVAGESVNAWNDYIVLDNFFKEYYNGEYWDSDKYD